MQDPNYNPNPYDSQDYESSLPYVPYANSSSDAPSPPASDVPPRGEYLASPEYNDYFSYPSVPGPMPQSDMAPVDSIIPGQFAPPPLFPAPPATRDKKRPRRLWITLGALLLVVVSVSTFALLSYFNRSTPTKTLDTFCNALQKEDYQTAYNQFSPSLQMRFNERDFAGALSPDKIAKCTHGEARESGTSITTSLQLVHSESKGVNNDSVNLTKDGNNQWKINDLQRA